ncbi:formate C-acetyltransferase [Aridibaculum aurantiacum]|uniref:formate C-acetyltransferase n=1 Tax=Aridibaculum aurantiacum TaxID=2810307 RepID=UPI001A95C8E4|nr:formate C-acetyltransferase [Aridibaculum aurantiacum]
MFTTEENVLIEFNEGRWTTTIDVKDFVKRNVTPYYGDASFLEGPTDRTKALWQICLDAMKEERERNGCRAIDTEKISTITSHAAGYIHKELEVIVGLQTDELLKRAMKPYGGIRVVEGAVEEKGLKVAESVREVFKYAKDHNSAVFSAYDSEILKCRSKGILTGLPDNYARGRIIGDYRRLALYGINKLIAAKQADKAAIDGEMTEHKIKLREEVNDQIKALNDIKELGNIYGLDLSRPAENAQEAVQWVYMAYLAAVKEQDGAAMSLGNVSGFLDIYIQKDLEEGVIIEAEAQELIDQFVMKLRMIRHLRPAAYDEIFGGDPTWVTEAIGGQFKDGRTKVTKTSFRFLQTLYNLGPSPEPNLTVLWSVDLPEGFKEFCAKVSIDTSSIQYENDDVMRPVRGSDDYGIACCVSYQELGKRIQFFGARTNLPKTLLLALNAGKEEEGGVQLIKGIAPLETDNLQYDEVMNRFKLAMKEIARIYVKSMNIIHYMHDKYYYEKAQLAFIDTDPGIDIAYGAAGISIIADSLSAIKYAKVKAVRNEQGLTVDFETEGDYPKYGNDDDRVDSIAQEVAKFFFDELNSHKCYKNAVPTLSLLTITSNVMYGKKTGATPDGRKAGEAFAPGANPMHGRDVNGAIASLNSVAKIDYCYAQDGVSNTFSMVPKSLGSTREEQVENLVSLLDGYFSKRAQHLNVNVLNRETLEDAFNNPEKYPQLTIRVSGYAVNFTRLSKAHQLEVIARTFHERM